MRSKIHKTHESNQRTPKLTGIPDDIKAVQAEVARLRTPEHAGSDSILMRHCFTKCVNRKTIGYLI